MFGIDPITLLLGALNIITVFILIPKRQVLSLQLFPSLHPLINDESDQTEECFLVKVIKFTLTLTAAV